MRPCLTTNMVAMTACKWLTVCMALETTGAACQQKQWYEIFMVWKHNIFIYGATDYEDR